MLKNWISVKTLHIQVCIKIYHLHSIFTWLKCNIWLWEPYAILPTWKNFNLCNILITRSILTLRGKQIIGATLKEKDIKIERKCYSKLRFFFSALNDRRKKCAYYATFNISILTNWYFKMFKSNFYLKKKKHHMKEFRFQIKSDAFSCNMKQPLNLLTFANTQILYNAKQNMFMDKLVPFGFRLQNL